MQLQELVAQVEDNIGRDDKTDKIPAYINLALQRIANDYPYFDEWERISYRTIDPDDEDTDPRRVPLPENLGTIVKVLTPECEHPELERITTDEYDSKYYKAYTDKAKRKEPRVYARWGNYIAVYPIPDKEIKYYIRRTIRPKKLEDDSDTPYIPYDNVIIECATMIAFNRIGLLEEGRNSHQVYQSYLKSAIESDRATNRDRRVKMDGFTLNQQTSRLETKDRGRVF